MSDETKLAILKALADPSRFHIVQCLAESCCCGRAAVRDDGGVEGPTAGEVCCHITGAEKITSTISHHLHELEAVGLLKLERRGKTTICTLIPEPLEALAQELALIAKSETDRRCC